MKRIIFLLGFLLAFSISNAQQPAKHDNGVIIGSFASDPTGVMAGQIYWNTTDDKLRQYNGTIWEDISSGGGGATIDIEDEGILTVTAATILNFVGSAVTVADAGSNEATITIVGGSGESTTVSDTAEIDMTMTVNDITSDIVVGSIDETKLDASTNASLNLADTALQSFTEVDGSTSNELQNLTWVDGTNEMQISNGTNATITGFLETEVDGSITNEHQDLTWNDGTNTVEINNGSNAVITGFLESEVDGSISNELQTIANTSDATTHTATLSDSGGSLQLAEGANITLTTTGTGLDGIVTIASTGGGATQLTDLSDVNTATVTNRNVLVADGVDFESRQLVELDISDFGTYLTSEVDGSTTNELNTGVSMTAGSLGVTDAGGTESVSLISTDGGNTINAGADGKLYSAAGAGESTTVSDTAEIDLTLTGADISADIVTGSIDVLKLDLGVQGSLGSADTALQSEIDGSITNEHQDLTWNDGTNTVEINNGTNATITGFLESEVDGSITNEHQDLSWNDGTNTVEINDGTNATITGFLETEVDGSVVNELQTLSNGSTATTHSTTLSNSGGSLQLIEGTNINLVTSGTALDGAVTINSTATGESTTVSDTAEIDLTLTGSDIEADIVTGSIDETKLDASTNASLNLADTALQSFTEVDGSTSNELQNLTWVDGTNEMQISNGTNATITGFLESEVDGSVTNEGSLTVGAGTGTTSLISSNTSGSTDVTITAGTNMTISEAGNNITLNATADGVGIDGSITDNQLAFGATTANEIEGSADLTYDGTILALANTKRIEIGGASVTTSFQNDGVYSGNKAFNINSDELYIGDEFSNPNMYIGGTGNGVTVYNDLTLSTVTNAGTDTDKFLVLSGTDQVEFRTGAEVLADIGGGAASSPLTTKGDLYTYTTLDARLPVGTNGQVLSANSAQATGLEWIDAAAGGGTSGMVEKTVEFPNGSEDITLFYTKAEVVFTDLGAVLVGISTPSVTWTLRYAADRNATGTEVITGGTTTTSTTTTTWITSFNNATVPLGNWVWLETTAQSGTVEQLAITMMATGIGSSGGGSGVTDGDKGDITVTGSGATWTIDDNTIGVAELSATGTANSTTYLRGDNTWATVAGSGDVSKVGTPVDNQIGVWTGDGTIEGTTGLTYERTGGTTDILGFLGDNVRLTAGASTIFEYTDGNSTLTATGVSVVADDFNGVALTTAGSATAYLNGSGTYTTPAGGGTIGGTITDNKIAVGATTANDIEGYNSFNYDNSTNTQTIGIDDSGNGSIALYGGAATASGNLKIYHGASDDTSNNYWQIAGAGSSFAIQPETTGGALTLGITSVSMVAPNGTTYIGVTDTEGTIESNTDAYLLLNSDADGNGSSASGIQFAHDDIVRWEWESNSGVDMKLNRYNAAGAFLDQPIQITAAGTIVIKDMITRTGGITNLLDGANTVVAIDTGVVTVTGDVDATNFNGVALTDAGSATNFLNEQGNYVAAGGGSTPTLSKGVTIIDPVATDDMTLFYTPVAITVTDVRSHITGTTNVVFNISWAASRISPATDVFTSNITLTSTSGASNSSGFNDNTIPASSWIWLDVVSVSGAPSRFHGTVIYTED